MEKVIKMPLDLSYTKTEYVDENNIIFYAVLISQCENNGFHCYSHALVLPGVYKLKLNIIRHVFDQDHNEKEHYLAKIEYPYKRDFKHQLAYAMFWKKNNEFTDVKFTRNYFCCRGEIEIPIDECWFFKNYNEALKFFNEHYDKEKTIFPCLPYNKDELKKKSVFQTINSFLNIKKKNADLKTFDIQLPNKFRRFVEKSITQKKYLNNIFDED